MVRARDLGIPFDGTTGQFNSLTDVQGVEVGHSTIIKGEGELVVGKGPIRTGVTVIFPVGKNDKQVFGGIFSLNGNGEMTGSHWVEESGLIMSPICITNTHSVGKVRDFIIEWKILQSPERSIDEFRWFLPIVAETYDGVLNDINGFHVSKEHVFEAIDRSKSPNTEEGNVGGGTGMICHQFKGGIGTSSRVIQIDGEDLTVGVLVQANYGNRSDLTIGGVNVGKELTELMPKINQKEPSGKEGSLIVIIATDAPLLPYQLKRLCKRVIFGLGRVGGHSSNSSGDIFLAFSTHNSVDEADSKKVHDVKFLGNSSLDPLFKSVAQATEEAIINSLVAAETMQGINNNTVYALPHDRVLEVLRTYRFKLEE
ncbi:MAG: P1 family peptidase [Candidatus Heimdallarchaeota archaeon]|nr:P1 family peptidase [Candidatus Heimdallarchaeota archaeon]